MFSFQPRIMKLAKKQESMTRTLRNKKQATETPVRVTMLDLTEKDFKVAIINMFNKLKESVIKEVKEGMTTSHQMETINKEKV